MFDWQTCFIFTLLLKYICDQSVYTDIHVCDKTQKQLRRGVPQKKFS